MQLSHAIDKDSSVDDIGTAIQSRNSDEEDLIRYDYDDFENEEVLNLKSTESKSPNPKKDSISKKHIKELADEVERQHRLAHYQQKRSVPREGNKDQKRGDNSQISPPP